MNEKLDLDALERALIGSAMGLTFRECQALIKYARSLEATPASAQQEEPVALTQRLIDAIEGECGGIGITQDQASKILAYVRRGNAIDDQDARFAIDGAIAYGRMGIKRPPDGHWLTEYWSIGQQLVELGKTSAWDNQTPVDAMSPKHALYTRPQASAQPSGAEDSVAVPVATLKWWRELVDMNPADLAPRIDAYIRDAARAATAEHAGKGEGV